MDTKADVPTEYEQADLDAILVEVRYLRQQFDRFLPLLESYEQAKKANGFLAARRAMKG